MSSPTCAHCASELSPGLRFCTRCGERVPQQPAPPAAAAAAAAASGQCRHCQRPLTAGARACAICGAPVAPPAPVPPPAPPTPPTPPAPPAVPVAPGRPDVDEPSTAQARPLEGGATVARDGIRQPLGRPGWMPAGAVPRPPAPERPAPPPEPAPIGHRFLARLIDSLVLTAVFIPVIALLLALVFMVVRAGSDAAALPIALSVNALVVLLPYAYEMRAVGRSGQSIGKQVMGVQVVDEQQLTPIGAGRALLRLLLLGLTGSLFGLGYLSFLFDSTGQRRTWADRGANARVITVERVPFGAALRHPFGSHHHP